MFRIFRMLKDFFRSRRFAYGTALIAILVDYGLQLVVPWSVGYLTDVIRTGQLTRTNFTRTMILILATMIINYLVTLYWNMKLYGSAQILMRDMRLGMLAKFLIQTPLFYGKFTKATLLTRMMDDTDTLETFSGYAMMCLVDSTIYPLTIILFMGFTISWPLTVAAVIPILSILPIYLTLSKKVYTLYDEQQDSYETLYSQVLENISAVRLTRAYRMELKVEADFQAAVQDTYEKTMKVSRLDAVFNPINRIASAIALLVAIGLGAYFMSLGQVTLGNLVSFNIYLGFLIWPMLAFGDFVNFTQQATASMERINELMAFRDHPLERADAIAYEGNGGLRAEDYHFTYPGATEAALDDLNFALEPGQTLGIVGKTGSGKSTLVRQLLHLYPQDLLTKGRLMLGARSMNGWTPASVRGAVGYVPQDHFLFSDTIAGNVRFGKPDADDTEIEEALTFADFWKDLAHLEQGIETVVGEKGVTLSGGQKQRLAIARAVLRDPEILILDDSLSAVDANTEVRILDHIREQRSGRMTIITAHRLSAVTHADLILVLDEGRIVAQGTHAELMDQEGWYRTQYIHQQHGGHDHDNG